MYVCMYVYKYIYRNVIYGVEIQRLNKFWVGTRYLSATIEVHGVGKI